MPWPEIKMQSWTDFAGRAERVTQDEDSFSAFGRSNVFRGQADRSWDLCTSLQRLGSDFILTETKLAIVEENIIDEFREQAHLHMNTADLRGSDDLVWWTVMQHYGVPTRILDWTQSPFVAAYFAARKHFKKDGAIWYFNKDRLRQHNCPRRSDEEKSLTRPFLDQLHQSKTFHFSTALPQERMVAQQGSFTVSSNVTTLQHEELAQVLDVGGDAKLGKWIIPWQQKPTFLAMLESMNISARTLFPGVDGFGQSIAESASLRSLQLNSRKYGIGANKVGMTDTPKPSPPNDPQPEQAPTK